MTADSCLSSRVPALTHCWSFDGDDPYVICLWCHERQDALTGRVITPGRAPQRIQMTRQRPWRADHPDAVIVARPSKWGNPKAIGQSFDWPVLNKWVTSTIKDAAEAVEYYRLWLDGLHPDTIPPGPTRETIRAELAGKDLACWCPLDSPCHADVLLELANGGDR